MKRNNYVKILKTLINYGIEDNEVLKSDERLKRILEFKDDLSYQKYENLFLEIENYLLDSEVTMTDKDVVITNLLEFIRLYPKIENNFNSFPNTILNIYKSFMDLNGICVTFESIDRWEITMVVDFENFANMYFEYLDKKENELFIHLCYSKIESLNNRIINYLNKKDFNDVKNIDNINNPELIGMINSRIDSLKNGR